MEGLLASENVSWGRKGSMDKVAMEADGPVKPPLVGQKISPFALLVKARYGCGPRVSRFWEDMQGGRSTEAQVFHRTTGEIPRTWPARERIRASCRRLLESDRSIEAIAFDLGFEGASLYPRQFRRRHR